MRTSLAAAIAASSLLAACLPAHAGIADALIGGLIQGVTAGVTERVIADNPPPPAYVSGCAMACGGGGVFGFGAVAEDGYPAGERPLPPAVAAQVELRHGAGLSLAGFYNDPTLALASPPPAAYVEPAPVGEPAMVYGGYGRPRGYYGHVRAHARFGGGYRAGARFAGGGGHFGGGSVHVK